MPVLYRKVQNKIPKSKVYQKWFLQAVARGSVSTKDLADEISHSTTVTYADILAVLIELSVAVRKHLLNSDVVHLEGLGAFRAGLRSTPADTEKEATANNIKATRVLYRPESTFIPNGKVGDKGHRQGSYAKNLLQGVTFKEFAASAAKVETGNTGDKQTNP